MEKFIPYEKLSKREKKKRDAQRRTTWGEFNPVTRKPENPREYNRKKAQSWKKESNSVPFSANSNSSYPARLNVLWMNFVPCGEVAAPTIRPIPAIIRITLSHMIF